MRAQQDHCRAAGLDAVVLQDETTGGACDCGAGARRYSNCAGEPAAGIPQLDEKHPGLDAFTAALVGTQDSSVVLRELQASECGGGWSSKVHEVRIGQADAGPGRARYVVQF